MKNKYETLSKSQIADAKQLRLDAMHLQEIENNPLDVSQIAMFEMFEREGWSHEDRIAFIKARITDTASINAAE